MRAADAAEARGDVELALDIIRGRWLGPDGRPWWRPWRVTMLEEIAARGPSLPGWARSRWLVSQAVQHAGPGTCERHQKSLRIAVGLRGGPQVLPGADGDDALCKVIDHDWVHRQLVAYDLGGLQHFLEQVASPELVTSADCIAHWTSAAMGGYQLVTDQAGDLCWEDLRTAEPVRLLDLGASTLLDPGGCAIGRVVPTTDGAMFETAPLPVPEDVAGEVAAQPAHWLDVLRRGCEKYGVGPRTDSVDSTAAIIVAGHHDFDILTDCPRRTG